MAFYAFPFALYAENGSAQKSHITELWKRRLVSNSFLYSSGILTTKYILPLILNNNGIFALL